MSVQTQLINVLSREMKIVTDHTLLQEYGKLITKLGNLKFITGVSKCVAALCYKPGFESTLNLDKNSINFKNGMYDFGCGRFRKRKATDLVSRSLNYDYYHEVDDEAVAKIEKILLRICNEDNKLKEYICSFLGYCLTGHTKEQQFLIILGRTASNGKSFIAKMMDKSFPIYVVKLDNQTFNANYQKRQKQISRVIAPVRFVFIEEPNRQKLDINILKDFVDGYKMNNEIMWGTSGDVHLQCKLVWFTNHLPSFDTDSGYQRRGRLVEVTNRFVSPLEFNKSKGKKGVYLIDDTLEDLFLEERYKLALFHVLAPYATRYIKQGLLTYEPAKEEFEGVCEDNDKMKDFVEEFFVTTSNENDRIGKIEFMNLFKDHYRLPSANWGDLLNDIKRIGLKYDRTLRSRAALLGSNIENKEQLMIKRSWIKEMGACRRTTCLSMTSSVQRPVKGKLM